MRRIKQALAVATATAAAVAASPARAAVLTESGDFVAYVESLRNLAFDSGSGLYVAPTPQDRAAFALLAADLWTASTPQHVAALDLAADALGYEVVQFTHNANNAVYLGLREQLVNNQQQTGWGSYFVRQGPSRDAMVQVPHPINDTRTWEVGAVALLESDARGFLLAGAHRNANGLGTADVADPIGSIFQVVHEQWNGPAGETVAWQVHGFNLANHIPPERVPGFPLDTDAVISNGTGAVSPEIVALDAALEAAGGLGWVSYAYNTLDPTDALNVLVNGGVDGETFGPPGGLGATTNAQQIYSTGIGGTFVHIELGQTIRFNPDGASKRLLAGQAIAQSISDTTEVIPEPAGPAPAAGRRRRHDEPPPAAPLTPPLAHPPRPPTAPLIAARTRGGTRPASCSSAA